MWDTKLKTWVVDPTQLNRLDIFLARYTQFRVEEGVKYARWLVIDYGDNGKASPFYDSVVDEVMMDMACAGLQDIAVANVFDGVLIGKRVIILMFMPYFD